MRLSALLKLVSSAPELEESLSVDQLHTLLDLVCLLKPTLSIIQPGCNLRSPPEQLPINVHEFLRCCLGVDDETMKVAWRTLSRSAWGRDLGESFAAQLSGRYLQMFLDHGRSRGIAYHHFYPPTRVCLNPKCLHTVRNGGNILVERNLVEALTVEVTVFTWEFGPVPGLATSMYCRSCNTRYYHNYYVHSPDKSNKNAKGDTKKIRTYYTTSSSYLQFGTHTFIAMSLCELFSTMMVIAWTSATNCARIYNEGLATNSSENTPSLPAAIRKSLELRVKDVWNSLFLYWLINDSVETGSALNLEHDCATQADRLLPALRSRNTQMVGTGQENWNHACDKCCWIDTAPDESQTVLRSVVVDGITVGHPCCGVHDCTQPLASVKDRFCSTHQHLKNECAVVDCNSPVTPGLKTCANEEHRSLELYLDERNKAMFQLKHRFERLKIAQPTDSLAEVNDDNANLDTAQGSVMHADEEVEVHMEDVCNGKPNSGNRNLKARFGRRRTHNEELCVASCGVILGRATFFGLEAPNGVRAFLMGLFPTQESLPGVIWHDNNCKIRKMLANNIDPKLKGYFDNCAMPVDVFHFKSKHKESDVECNEYCNPYKWAELRTDEGNWCFNSSAAEQANAWFGGYQSIVREMQVDRYNFFLDEMLKRRNRLIVRDLEDNFAPYHIPRHILLGDM